MPFNLALTYLFLVVLVGLDWLTKSSVHLSGHFIKNEGIVMGFFSESPLMVKVIFLFSIAMFFLTLFIFMTVFLRLKSRGFLSGVTFFFAGILGNVLDRIVHGYVTDFINIYGPLHLNLADIFQGVGVILMVVFWRKELNVHLPKDNKRFTKLFQSKTQMRYVWHLTTLYFSIVLAFYGFSYVFLKYALIESESVSPEEINVIISSFSLLFLSFVIFMGLVVFIAIRIMAKRTYGPIQAIENYLEDTIKGKTYPLKLRENDYFKTLEGKLTQLNKEMTNEK